MSRLTPSWFASLALMLCLASALVAEDKTFPGKKSDFSGFVKYEFPVDGCNALVVVPKEAAPGKPWIWRPQFFGHEPQADIALLGKGFHVVYIELDNTFGAPDALAHFDAFYKLLVNDYGLSPKPALEGFSRGGLFVFNWAAAHPNQVSCIYADAPVCDFKSWPGGKSGKRYGGDWNQMMKAYHFKTEAEAQAYAKNPIDNLKPLADAKIPLLHVVGDADDIVPLAENTKIVEERYKALGGSIEVIHKPRVKHHPHSLKDPKPIVDFVVKHCTQGEEKK